jgi:hypothetical protein
LLCFMSQLNSGRAYVMAWPPTHNLLGIQKLMQTKAQG